MVCVAVGVDRPHEVQVEIPDHGQVTINLRRERENALHSAPSVGCRHHCSRRTNKIGGGGGATRGHKAPHHLKDGVDNDRILRGFVGEDVGCNFWSQNKTHGRRPLSKRVQSARPAPGRPLEPDTGYTNRVIRAAHCMWMIRWCRRVVCVVPTNEQRGGPQRQSRLQVKLGVRRLD